MVAFLCINDSWLTGTMDLIKETQVLLHGNVHICKNILVNNKITARLSQPSGCIVVNISPNAEVMISFVHKEIKQGVATEYRITLRNQLWIQKQNPFD